MHFGDPMSAGCVRPMAGLAGGIVPTRRLVLIALKFQIIDAAFFCMTAACFHHVLPVGKAQTHLLVPIQGLNRAWANDIETFSQMWGGAPYYLLH